MQPVHRAAINCVRDPRLVAATRRIVKHMATRGDGHMLEPHGDFRPLFAAEDICVLASEYVYLDDAEARRAGQSASERRYLTLDELVVIGSWKTRNRQRHNLIANDEGAVREATTIALDPGTGERDRLTVLRNLTGVQAPVASAILHFVDPDRWSILDYRILEALGVARPNYYSLDYWEAFQAASGDLAAAAGVDRRCFDKAGFMWSKVFGKHLDERIDDEDSAPKR